MAGGRCRRRRPRNSRRHGCIACTYTGGHAAHGQAAEGPVLGVFGDGEQLSPGRDDPLLAVAGDFAEIPLMSPGCSCTPEWPPCLALGDQVVHHVADGALAGPVGLVAAAPVGHQDQRVGLVPVKLRGQVDSHTLGLAIDVAIGQIGEGSGLALVANGQAEAFLLRAHIQLAVLLLPVAVGATGGFWGRA